MKLWAVLVSLFLALCTAVFPAFAQDRAPPAGRVATHGARDLVDVAPAGPSMLPPALPADYMTTRRGPLVIAYPRRMASQVAPVLARAARDADAVAAQLGVAPVPELQVRLVPDPDAMRALAPAALPPPAYAVGVAYPSVRLAIVSSSAPRTWEASDMPRVLRHELSHLLLAEATHHADLPRWLAEGIAVEQSGEHSFERFEELATASFTGGVLPLRRLDAGFSEGPGDVNVAYAESADFVAYLLRSDGAPRFALMLAHVRAGMSLDQAMHEAYGASLAHVEEEWRHDMESRFALAPLWAGTGILWAAGVALLIAGAVRRRRKSRETLARWAREEDVLRSRRMVVVTPGAWTQPPPTPAPDADDDDLPKISLDGERHTLH